MNHLVIMAGGIGSRFWPMSRPENPKQFIDVLGVGRTLLQLTIDRFGEEFSPENIWVVTSNKYASKVAEQLPSVPKDNILLEPCMRNTAPCIAYVTWKIKRVDPDATLVISPADHFVVNINEFRRVIRQGISFVKGSSNVLTLGMFPTRPDTGYGYIQAGDEISGSDICYVKAFKEKPQLPVAKQYLSDGGYYWNAGLFIWDAATAEAAMRLFEPEIAMLFDNMSAHFGTDKEEKTVDELFPQCRSISIDYAIMERMSGKNISLRGMNAGVYVLPSDFGWSDLGTWGSLYMQLDRDSMGNAIVGEENVRLIESNDCIVRASGDLKMVIQGLDGYIVADDNGTLLICKKNEEQRIKQFSESFNK
ncbi:MAG: mannose-1-phosphate guanylyltransferase [Marinilabiliaceae bacterium]|nr:mannose-1-phosphate guanylyltransferase [Marinilabiliaceae bacterium]